VLAFVAACGRIGFDAVVADGCADGTREGFGDVLAFPNIAACATTWSGALDMRAAPSGVACGNDLAACAAPADACVAGWHLCASDGSIDQVVAVGPAACSMAGSGAFAAAASHIVANPPCTYANPGAWTCVGYEPFCCGTGCMRPNCRDGMWPGMTLEVMGGGACNALPASGVDGVLCCRGP
jgi:hypothetical protein